MFNNQVGGEITTKGRDGKIRSKDTIVSGNDPYPPKYTGHKQHFDNSIHIKIFILVAGG